ncbi:MAG: hypothetical protein IT423_08010, partial [Pirellulaceae bacterium]|nr:hypothetical protein [Pirellulaceae bacterium]
MNSMICRRLLLCGLCLCLTSTAVAQNPAAEPDYSAELPRIKPLTVDEALKSFQVQPGFRVELVAAEPLVTDPVAFAFNGDGFLFVVEMRDYSEQETEHLGSIARLEDVDHDGRMDKRTTFAEGLSWPTAIWPWKNGVLVAEPPKLIWFGDSNGDGVSDTRQVWYEGFGRGNVQGLVNSLRWTVDGYIQGATSSSGADLKGGPETPDADKTIALRGRDFTLDPTTKNLEPASGGGQHGMCFNRWGDKFATSNSDHLQQIINLDSWLSSHTANVPIPSLRRSIAEDGPQAEGYRASPVAPWRLVRTRLRMSGAVPGVVEGGGRAAGYFTGATATCIMDREMGFGDAEHDTAIVCDVGSNLVHRKRMSSKGLFWSGQRIDSESELMRSSDIWFRPVQLGDGPDGALYVADMYREVIEHPKSLPPVIKKHLDLTSGRDRGRIWRLVPTASQLVTAPKATQLPGKMSATELVKQLDHPVAWQRRMASQLLIERGERDAVPALQAQAIEGKLPEGRLLALYVLNRLQSLATDVLKKALADKHPRVLAHAINLVAASGQASDYPALLKQLPVDDSYVQLALAMVAEKLPIDGKAELLSKVLGKTSEPLTRAVCLVAAGNDSPALFAGKLGDDLTGGVLPMVLPAWSSSLRGAAGADQAAFRQSLTTLLTGKLSTPGAVRNAWISSLSRLPSRSQADALLSLMDDKSKSDLMTYIRTSTQPKADGEIAKLEWSRFLPTEEVSTLAKELIAPTTVESQQLVMAESLLWNDSEQAIKILLPELPRMTPVLKSQVLGAIMRYSSLLERVASAIERKEISKAEIAPNVRQQLFAIPNKALAERFKELLNTASADRAQVIERYRPELSKVAELKEAQIASGRMAFQKVCAQCHRLQDIG